MFDFLKGERDQTTKLIPRLCQDTLENNKKLQVKNIAMTTICFLIFCAITIIHVLQTNPKNQQLTIKEIHKKRKDMVKLVTIKQNELKK